MIAKGLRQVTGGDSSNKWMVSFSDHIPKKSCKEAKHCAPCKKYWGEQNTHNTGDCKKNNLGCASNKSFAGKKAQCNSHSRSSSCKKSTSYVWLSAKIAKLEISNTKLNLTNKKCKHDYNNGNNSSDAS